MEIRKWARGVVEEYLKKLVRIKLRRTHPTIIGVTGSFGKTSTKEAIYEILKTRGRTYRNAKSLNTEIGLLLAVLEQPSGFRSPLKWAKILANAARNAFASRPYDSIILEYGADKPGDIEQLISRVKPHIAIITRIAAVHQAKGQFARIEDVFQEKQKLASCLSQTDIAILNYADSFLKKLEGRLTAKILWFNGEDIWASDIRNTATGFSATIHSGDKKMRANFGIHGAFHLDCLLPALLLGTQLGISLEKGITALEKFRLPPGRMSLIPGLHGSLIIDSTYNASPQTMKEALKILKEFPGTRKIAVLGTMNELGEKTAEAHREVAHEIGEWVDLLITVGDGAREIAETALKKGFPEHKIRAFRQAGEAGEFLIAYGLKKDDIILLKGSQNNVRLERTVKMLMKNPEDAAALLCRQEDSWEKIQ